MVGAENRTDPFGRWVCSLIGGGHTGVLSLQSLPRMRVVLGIITLCDNGRNSQHEKFN
jgi:hypothetical protein